jgi:hypothetical protein
VNFGDPVLELGALDISLYLYCWVRQLHLFDDDDLLFEVAHFDIFRPHLGMQTFPGNEPALPFPSSRERRVGDPESL